MSYYVSGDDDPGLGAEGPKFPPELLLAYPELLMPTTAPRSAPASPAPAPGPGSAAAKAAPPRPIAAAKPTVVKLHPAPARLQPRQPVKGRQQPPAARPPAKAAPRTMSTPPRPGPLVKSNRPAPARSRMRPYLIGAAVGAGLVALVLFMRKNDRPGVRQPS